MVKLVLDLRWADQPQTYAEYQPAARKNFDAQQIEGSVTVEVLIYSGEQGKYDLDVMRNHLIARGAKAVKIIYKEFQHPTERILTDD
jgi:hypothetical protein